QRNKGDSGKRFCYNISPNTFVPAHGSRICKRSKGLSRARVLDPAAIPPEFLHVLADVKDADKMDIDNGPSTDGVCSI
nr:hypothetical protein [Tanacetum cinerariifolium]